MVKVKDLRNALKSVDGEAELSFGNYTGYSPRVFGDNLNLFWNDLSIFHPKETKPNKEIKKATI